MDDQNKNLILASILSLLVIIIWTVLFPAAETDLPADTVTTTASAPAGDTALTPGSAGGEVSTETTAPAEPLPESAPRVAVETPSVTGSISLRGGRLDELALNNYRESLDPGAEIVTLLNPTGSASPYYALFGWAPGTGLMVLGLGTRYQAQCLACVAMQAILAPCVAHHSCSRVAI